MCALALRRSTTRVMVKNLAVMVDAYSLIQLIVVDVKRYFLAMKSSMLRDIYDQIIGTTKHYRYLKRIFRNSFDDDRSNRYLQVAHRYTEELILNPTGIKDPRMYVGRLDSKFYNRLCHLGVLWPDLELHDILGLKPQTKVFILNVWVEWIVKVDPSILRKVALSLGFKTVTSHSMVEQLTDMICNPGQSVEPRVEPLIRLIKEEITTTDALKEAIRKLIVKMTDYQ